MVISQSSCGTRVNVCDLFKATAAKQIPKRDRYASVISKLKLSNMNSEIFVLLRMTHQPGTYEMKYENAQI